MILYIWKFIPCFEAKLASQMSGTKGKLVVTPPNSGGLPRGGLSTGLLRKPANKPSSKMMLKKKPSGPTKLRVNKLSVSKDTSSDDGFDNMDNEGQNDVPKEEEEPKQKSEEKNDEDQTQCLVQLSTLPVAVSSILILYLSSYLLMFT